MADWLLLYSKIMFAASAGCGLLTVILFFTLHIPRTVAELRGKRKGEEFGVRSHATALPMKEENRKENEDGDGNRDKNRSANGNRNGNRDKNRNVNGDRNGNRDKKRNANGNRNRNGNNSFLVLTNEIYTQTDARIPLGAEDTTELIETAEI